jgi:hypothetical protein
MALHVFVFVFLLVVCLLRCLGLLWRLDWFPRRPATSRGGTKRITLHRLRHRPVAQTIARPVVWPLRRRQVEGERLLLCAAFREVKSRRGARHSGEHRRLRLSQSTVQVLRQHR